MAAATHKEPSLFKGSGLIFNNIKALNKSMPKKSDVSSQIDYYNLDATKQDISDWQSARLEARDYLYPYWANLIRVYDDVIIDSHLFGLIANIKEAVKAKEFELVDKSGKKSNQTELLNKEWFFDFLDYAIEGYYYPYSVIQLGNIVDDAFNDIKMIPREYYIKQHTFITKTLYPTNVYKNGENGWNISLPEYRPYYIVIESDNDLGMLDKVAYHALGKKHMLIYWWRLGEQYGLPIRIGKTDMNENKRRRDMENMLSNMGNNLWAVIDEQDSVELKESGTKTASVEVFKENLSYSNDEMSKVILGSTGITDEKSFVGSAEVGERLYDARVKALLRKLKFIINKELIPRMAWYGLPVSGLSFNWINEDKITYNQKLETIKGLAQYFDFDDKEISEKLGLKLKAKQPNINIQPKTISSVMPEVKALYKQFKAPLPEPNKDERKTDFIARCMSSEVMILEYPDEEQRKAVCYTQYDNK